jgi:SAM-dependent methyltransferase
MASRAGGTRCVRCGSSVGTKGPGSGYSRPVDRDWRATFEETYTGSPSAVTDRIWREVFGAEYPDGLDPYSFVTRSELDRFKRDLQLAAGDRLVDLGCGRGGAGLWVAAATQARLTGIDIAESALVDARERAARMGLAADFRRGEFEATGLPTADADALMSVDALLFTPNKAAALTELRRILRPGGRLCVTSWDYHRQPVGRPPQVPDHRPLLEPAGFRLIAYDETDDWRARQERVGQLLLDHVEELSLESGLPVEEMRAGLNEMNATTATMSRRFFLVAEAA